MASSNSTVKRALLLGVLCLSAGGCGSTAAKKDAAPRDAASLNAEGERLLEARRLQEAETVLGEALEASTARGDTALRARSLYNLGRVHGWQQRYAQALGEFQASEKLFVRLRMVGEASRAMAGQGAVNLMEGRLALARKDFKRALADAPDDVATQILKAVEVLRLEQAQVARSQREASSKEPHILDSMELSKQEGTSSRGRDAESLRALGDLAASEGDDARAELYYRQAADAYRDAGMNEDASQARKQMDEHRRPSTSILEDWVWRW